MLVLLPPSEGKTAPSGPPLDLDELAFATALGAPRRKVMAAAGGPRKLRAAPAGPAAEVYSGVLFSRLDRAALEASDHVLVTSAMWGLLRPRDRIPLYKLAPATPLPRLGHGLAATWRPALETALADRDSADELVIDMRSGPYARLWQPRRARHLAVRAFRVGADGSRVVVSHMAKAARGDVTRALLDTSTLPRSPEEVAAIATHAGFDVELGAGTLDVLEHG